MSSYPSAVATFREKTNLPGVTFVDPDKATIYAEDLTQIEGEIVAVETVLGTNPEGTAATVSERIADTESALDTKQPSLGFVPENVTNKDTTATLGSSDTKYPSQKAVKTYTDNQISSLQSQITALKNRHEYAVGDIFLSFNSTNPATSKGYGTWALRGQGRTLVGVDTGDTDFNTVKKTGGAKTHTLTIAEMPSHSHVQGVSGGMTYTGAGNASAYDYGQGRNTSNISTNETGGGGAHNNLQPYLTCYIWERTA